MNLEESKNCEHDNLWRMYSPLGISLLIRCLVRWSVFLSATEMHSSVFILKSLLSSCSLPLS